MTGSTRPGNTGNEQHTESLADAFRLTASPLPGEQPHQIDMRQTFRAIADLYRTFGPHLKPYWASFGVAYLAMAVTALLLAARPFPLKWILDYVLLQKPLPEEGAGRFLLVLGSDPRWILVLLCLFMVGLVFFQGVFSYAQRYLLASAARRTSNEIRKRVFHHLQSLPLSFRAGTSSGDLVLRMTGDINELRKLLVDSVSEFLRIVFTFSWIVVLMVQIDWRLTLLAMVVVPPLFLVSRRFTRQISGLTRIQRHQESKVSGIIEENAGSMAVVQAFSQEAQEKERFDRETDESLRADLKRLQFSRVFNRAVDLLIATASALVVFFAGIMALNGRLEATHLVLFVPWLKDLYGPIEKLAELLLNFTNQLVCGERIAEILRHQPAVRDADDAVAAPPFRGEVRFDHVTFGYREGMSILRNLSFHVQPGQTVAIVGTSGAGKTTIANLLLRFFDPWEGSVQFDGQDVRHYTLESLRQQMTVVLQDSILFNRTIRENIAYGRSDAGWEEIVAAAKAAEIHDFIVKLPESYETLLEEGATNLSGGQKQRLALARALLRDTPILILDEPVTQLDAITETRVNRSIARVTEGRTAFIIAHRLSTIQRADLILVIEEGRVAESGTHSKLIASSGFYRELYGSQYAPLQTVES